MSRGRKLECQSKSPYELWKVAGCLEKSKLYAVTHTSLPFPAQCHCAYLCTMRFVLEKSQASMHILSASWKHRLRLSPCEPMPTQAIDSPTSWWRQRRELSPEGTAWQSLTLIGVVAPIWEQNCADIELAYHCGRGWNAGPLGTRPHHMERVTELD